tara:strand:+ start:33205 stop:34542 length:1338 start_codon:yes stop_codon:yes gene_type:complete
MSRSFNRREFTKRLGISAAAANMVLALPSLGYADSTRRKQRLVFVFSPNGVIPKHFWPDKAGRDFDLKRILQPLTPLKDHVLSLQGVCNKIKGDGDGHMRGIGCLLTGVELFPGDVQGGSDTPAGWSTGISIDQHLKNQLQADEATRTRFGSLEFGVLVPSQADTWTRMCYAGPNRPVAPISDPYQMFDKLYGQKQNRKMLASVLDDLTDDLKKIQQTVGMEDRQILQQHLSMVRRVELDLQTELAAPKRDKQTAADIPKLPPNVAEDDDNMPQISKMQIEMVVNSMAADFTRIASIQMTKSVGNARMRWLDIDEGHHSISHEPDSNESAYENLIKINTWYCEQVAHLAKRLSETPEPGGEGNLLDNTTIIWTNELGKGNSHTRDNIPFIMVGGGLGFDTGRAMKFDNVPHNRLLLSILEAMGYPQKSFGNADYCGDGPLTGLFS